MHWSRIKSILIAVFIVLNVYLLIQYFKINENNDILSYETVNNTVTFLKSKNITVSRDIIPKITERDPETGSAFKTGADALITFSDAAQNSGITPCTVKSLTLKDGIWTIVTDKGEFKFNATDLNSMP